jgi:UDP-MurNAc hydroxylase
MASRIQGGRTWSFGLPSGLATSPADASIRYLGHAGFAVRHAGITLLIDPWFYPAFLQAWFPFPDNRDLLSEVVNGHFDALYVSHAHEDHFDERVLSLLDRRMTILVPRYRSKVMSQRLAAMGFENLVLLGHREQYKLASGFSVTMLLDISHKEDSGLLVDLDGFRFLDLNDCNTPMSELPSEIDLLAAQYPGAMWYPNCYKYPPTVMAEKVADVRASLIETLTMKVRLTGARAYLPCAGPPCFLDPVLDVFNDNENTISPVWDDVATRFAAVCPETEVFRLAPGDVLDRLASGTLPRLMATGAKPWPIDRERYISEYRERRRAEWEACYKKPEGLVTAAEMEQYFRRLQDWNKRFLGDYRKDIRLVADGLYWGIRLGLLAEQSVFEDEPIDADYTLYVPPRVLRAILDGTTGWEEALLSMRLSLHRTPDVFDLTLMSLLRYGNHPAQTMQLVREWENTETIVRDGLRMQRYCPHAGKDLTYATICDGIIECPRHHWKWDTGTGDCLDGGAVPLRVEPLENGSGMHAGRCDPAPTKPRVADRRQPAERR